MSIYNVASIPFVSFFKHYILTSYIAYEFNGLLLLIETMCELFPYSRARISCTSTSSININLFCKTLKMKLSVNQKKEERKEENSDKSSNRRF